MSLWKRGRQYWTDFTVNGRRYRKRLGTTNLRVATRRERDREPERTSPGDGAGFRGSREGIRISEIRGAGAAGNYHAITGYMRYLVPPLSSSSGAASRPETPVSPRTGSAASSPANGPTSSSSTAIPCA